MKNSMSLLAMLAMLGAVPALANEAKVAGQGVDKRVERQTQRIERKLKKNKISEEKAAELKKEVQAIDEKKDAMVKEGGGKLTKEQKKELHGDLKKTAEEIKAASSPAKQ